MRTHRKWGESQMVSRMRQCCEQAIDCICCLLGRSTWEQHTGKVFRMPRHNLLVGSAGEPQCIRRLGQ